MSGVDNMPVIRNNLRGLRFIGFHITLLVQHWIGVEEMPRRTANYPDLPGNVNDAQPDLLGRVVDPDALDAGVLLQRVQDVAVRREGQRRGPVGFGSSLEWATSCPPPRHNFYRIPRIRSERPAFELHYPDIKSGTASRALQN